MIDNEWVNIVKNRKIQWKDIALLDDDYEETCIEQTFITHGTVHIISPSCSVLFNNDPAQIIYKDQLAFCYNRKHHFTDLV